MYKEKPPGWGNDSISGFINCCLNNTFASYVKHNEVYSIFVGIDKLYRAFISALYEANTSAYVRLLLLRSHCAYLGAVRLALSTQVVESYMLARGCIESALYGLHMHGNSSLEQIWLDRHKGDDSKKKAKKEFAYVKVAETLKKIDSDLYKTTDYLYQLAIDCGGHPNEGAVTACLAVEKSADSKTMSLNYGYLINDEIPMVHSFKMVADVGSCALEIFGLVFPEEFRKHGINTALTQTEGTINKKIKLQNP